MVVHTAGMPEIVSIGPALDEFVPAAASRPVARATLDTAVPLGIIAETATGYSGRPGLVGARPDGSGWAPRFRLSNVDREGKSVATFHLVDELAELALELELRVDDVLTVRASLQNQGTSAFAVQRLAPSIPVPTHGETLLSFSGRWCREFQPYRV